jgi:hypothetical protein
MAAPFEPEPVEVIAPRDIARTFPGTDPHWIDRAVKLGVISDLHDDGYEVFSPRLLDMGARLVAAGVPVETLLDEGELLRADCDRIAERFVALFVAHVWEPFIEAGRPASELKKIVDYLALTRPLPVEATSVMMGQAMQRQFEKAIGELLDREVEAGLAADLDPPPGADV